MAKRRWVLGVPLGFLLLAGLVYGGIAHQMAWELTRVERHPVTTAPDALGMAYESVTFPSRGDALKLSGWWIPGDPQAPVVVLIHGLDTHRAAPTVGLLEMAGGLHQGGLSLLMFDLRGHGASEGTWTSGGYFEQRDVLGAVDFLAARGVPPQKVVLLGVSMGGAIALMVAPKISGLHAVIADSAYASLRDLIASETALRTGLPSWLTRWLVPGMEWVARIRWHLPVSEIAPWKAVKQLSYPILLIHGEQDERIPLSHALRLREAATHPQTRLWIVPGAGHARAFRTDPKGYLEQVFRYLEQQFPGFRAPDSIDISLEAGAE